MDKLKVLNSLNKLLGKLNGGKHDFMCSPGKAEMSKEQYEKEKASTNKE